MLDYLNEVNIGVRNIHNHKHVIKTIINKIMCSNTIFVIGNGGSSATASHFVNDLRKMCGLKAYCLSDNTPSLTAWANDESYGEVFSEQLKILGGVGDCLIVISGSGNSLNVINALKTARVMGITTIAFLGQDGGTIKKEELSDVILHIPTDMLHVEDLHNILCHLIAREIHDKYN